MKLIEIREWIDSLPVEFLEFEVVSCKTGELDEDHMWRLDNPIIGLDIDEENKEVLFFTQEEEDEEDGKDTE
jgi:hypothetical protein